MASFLQENIANIIVIAVLIISIVLVVIKIIKDKKSGKGTCNGDCFNCQASCSSRQNNKK